MSTENTVTERLLTEARKKTAKNENPMLGKVAVVIGVIAVPTNLVSILAAWIIGAIAIGLGAAAVRRPVSAKPAKIAMVLGFVAILIGVFFVSLAIARAG